MSLWCNSKVCPTQLTRFAYNNHHWSCDCTCRPISTRRSSASRSEPDRSCSCSATHNHQATSSSSHETCCESCCPSWSNEEYQSDSKRSTKSVRNRNCSSTDVWNSCWVPFPPQPLPHPHPIPPHRIRAFNGHHAALSDCDICNHQRSQQWQQQVAHKRSSSNSSERTIDSGKDSAITGSPSSLSSLYCSEPFYLHEPHMTSNDRVKKLFERDKVDAITHGKRYIKEDNLNNGKNIHLVTAEVHQSSDDCMSVSESSDPTPDYDVDEASSMSKIAINNCDDQSKQFGTASISSSEACSTSTDEVIYQELDDIPNDVCSEISSTSSLTVPNNKNYDQLKLKSAMSVQDNNANNEMKHRKTISFCLQEEEAKANEMASSNTNSSRTIDNDSSMTVSVIQVDTSELKSINEDHITKESTNNDNTNDDDVKIYEPDLEENELNDKKINDKVLTTLAPPPPPPPPPPPLPPINNMGSNKTIRSGLGMGSKSESRTEVNQVNEERTTYYEKNTFAKKCKKPQVLPFIPPQFSSPPDSDTNIRPSEYLKRVANRTVSAFPVPKYGYVRNEEIYGEKRQIRRSASENHLYSNPNINNNDNDYEVIKGESDGETEPDINDIVIEKKSDQSKHDIKHDINHEDESEEDTQSVVSSIAPTIGSSVTVSPMSTLSHSGMPFSITQEQLQNVLLKKTDKPNPNERTVVLLQKNDLIAELKQTKDLDGIKKVKEQTKNKDEVKEKIAEIASNFSAESFIDKIAEKDANGMTIPLWKRQMMAKKAAEKAKKEAEEQLVKEIEEKKANSVPAWKKQLKKKEETYGNPGYIKLQCSNSHSNGDSKNKIDVVTIAGSIKVNQTQSVKEAETKLEPIKENASNGVMAKEDHQVRVKVKQQPMNCDKPVNGGLTRGKETNRDVISSIDEEKEVKVIMRSKEGDNNNNNQNKPVNPFLKTFQLRKTNSIYW